MYLYIYRVSRCIQSSIYIDRREKATAVVGRGIPNEDACDALIELIKENGMWKDKEVEPAEEAAEAVTV